MYFFSLVTYAENGNLKIKLEIVKSNEMTKVAKLPIGYPISLQALTKRNFNINEYPLFLDEELNPQTFTKPIKSKEKKQCELQSFVYDFPTDPEMALYFIAVLQHFQKNCVAFTIDQNKSINAYLEDKNNSGLETLSLPDYYFSRGGRTNTGNVISNPYLRMQRYSSSHFIILENMLKIAAASNIDNIAIQAVKKFFSYCQYERLAASFSDLKALSLDDCLANKTLRDLILADNHPYLLSDPAISSKMKTSILSAIKYDYQNRNDLDFPNLIQKIHAFSILNSFQSCKMNNYYGEFELFLRHAPFVLGDDGRMRISNVDKNPAYSKYFAPGMLLHVCFESQLQYIGKLLGFRFDDCNFHKEIIFTEKCTRQLQARGLHYTKEYIEKHCEPDNILQTSFAYHSLFSHHAQKKIPPRQAPTIEEPLPEFNPMSCTLM